MIKQFRYVYPAIALFLGRNKHTYAALFSSIKHWSEVNPKIVNVDGKDWTVHSVDSLAADTYFDDNAVYRGIKILAEKNLIETMNHKGKKLIRINYELYEKVLKDHKEKTEDTAVRKITHKKSTYLKVGMRYAHAVILELLMSFVGKKDSYNPKIELISKITGFSEDTVCRAINDLSSEGFFAIEKVKSDNKKAHIRKDGHSYRFAPKYNSYKINWIAFDALNGRLSELFEASVTDKLPRFKSVTFPNFIKGFFHPKNSML